MEIDEEEEEEEDGEVVEVEEEDEEGDIDEEEEETAMVTGDDAWKETPDGGCICYVLRTGFSSSQVRPLTLKLYVGTVLVQLTMALTWRYFPFSCCCMSTLLQVLPEFYWSTPNESRLLVSVPEGEASPHDRG